MASGRIISFVCLKGSLDFWIKKVVYFHCKKWKNMKKKRKEAWSMKASESREVERVCLKGLVTYSQCDVKTLGREVNTH